jgi:hypothetical protein
MIDYLFLTIFSMDLISTIINDEELLAVHIHLKRNTTHLSCKRKEKGCLLLVLPAPGFTIPHTHMLTLKWQHLWRAKGENVVMMGMEAATVAGGFILESGHRTTAGSCLQPPGEGARGKRLEELKVATGSCLEPPGKAVREKRDQSVVPPSVLF